VDAIPTEEPKIILTSAKKKKGTEKLRQVIDLILSEGGIAPPSW
jgi:hypothetical protein